MGSKSQYGRENNAMVNTLISINRIRTKAVEKVFRAVDRGDYVTHDDRYLAYMQQPWRSGHLHLSAPCIYGEVLEALHLRPGQSFLNVGSGTGYFNTLVGLILGCSGINHGVEVYSHVVDYANQRLEQFLKNSPALDEFDFCVPKFHCGNGLRLSSAQKPYDRVYCGADCPAEFLNYFKQLIKIGGILVLPTDNSLLRIKRTGERTWSTTSLLNVVFASLQLPTESLSQFTIEWTCPQRLQILSYAVVRKCMRASQLSRHPRVSEPLLRCPGLTDFDVNELLRYILSMDQDRDSPLPLSGLPSKKQENAREEVSDYIKSPASISKSLEGENKSELTSKNDVDASPNETKSTNITQAKEDLDNLNSIQAIKSPLLPLFPNLRKLTNDYVEETTKLSVPHARTSAVSIFDTDIGIDKLNRELSNTTLTTSEHPEFVLQISTKQNKYDFPLKDNADASADKSVNVTETNKDLQKINGVQGTSSSLFQIFQNPTSDSLKETKKSVLALNNDSDASSDKDLQKINKDQGNSISKLLEEPKKEQEVKAFDFSFTTRTKFEQNKTKSESTPRATDTSDSKQQSFQIFQNPTSDSLKETKKSVLALNNDSDASGDKDLQKINKDQGNSIFKLFEEPKKKQEVKGFDSSFTTPTKFEQNKTKSESTPRATDTSDSKQQSFQIFQNPTSNSLKETKKSVLALNNDSDASGDKDLQKRNKDQGNSIFKLLEEPKKKQEVKAFDFSFTTRTKFEQNKTKSESTPRATDTSDSKQQSSTSNTEKWFQNIDTSKVFIFNDSKKNPSSSGSPSPFKTDTQDRAAAASPNKSLNENIKEDIEQSISASPNPVTEPVPAVDLHSNKELPYEVQEPKSLDTYKSDIFERLKTALSPMPLTKVVPRVTVRISFKTLNYYTAWIWDSMMMTYDELDHEYNKAIFQKGALLLAEAKVAYAQKKTISHTPNEEFRSLKTFTDEDLLKLTLMALKLPLPLAAYLECIGNIKIGEQLITPVIIDHPQNVLLSGAPSLMLSLFKQLRFGVPLNGPLYRRARELGLPMLRWEEFPNTTLGAEGGSTRVRITTESFDFWVTTRNGCSVIKWDENDYRTFKRIVLSLDGKKGHNVDFDLSSGIGSQAQLVQTIDYKVDEPTKWLTSVSVDDYMIKLGATFAFHCAIDEQGACIPPQTYMSGQITPRRVMFAILCSMYHS